MPTPQPRLELLGQLLDSALRGRTTHSLLANLSVVSDMEWEARPAGGDRSIGEIEHCAIAAELWRDTLLGGEQRTYDGLLHERRRTAGTARATTLDAVIAAHDGFLRSMRALDDEKLVDARRTHYGTATTVERAIVVLIEHAHFHAGEIGVLRGLVRSEAR